MRVAQVAPAACSGCFLAKPELVHVDFEVAWDGPTFPDGVMTGDGVIVNVVAAQIDDLVLCEECLRAAAAHVGLSDPDEAKADLEQIRTVNQTLAEKNLGLAEYVKRLEQALAVRPEPKPAQRKRQAVPA